MAKIEYIKKARKQWKCNKCGCTIEKGDSYFKAEINFGPTIVRCKKCGLQSWEVTTSEYGLAVGDLVHNWEEYHGAGDCAPESVASAVAEIRDDVQSRLDNMPESLQYSPTGELLQERIDALDSAESELEGICVDEFKERALCTYSEELAEAIPDYDEDSADADYYDALLENAGVPASIKEQLVEAFEDEVRDAIQEILDELEY